jgi:hypothetical protein
LIVDSGFLGPGDALHRRKNGTSFQAPRRKMRRAADLPTSRKRIRSVADRDKRAIILRTFQQLSASCPTLAPREFSR